VPDGSVRGQRSAWLRAVESWPAFLALRADARRNLLLIARVLAWHAVRSTSVSKPTRARTAALGKICERTVMRHWRALEAAGFLGVIEPGRTAAFLHGALADGGNLARAYVLCIPQPAGSTGTLRAAPEMPAGGSEGSPGVAGQPYYCRPALGAVGSLDSPTRSRTREQCISDTGSAGDSPPGYPSQAGQSAMWPLNRKPQRKEELLRAAEALRRESFTLRRLSARHVRHLARPYFAVGWTPGDLLWALDHWPSGHRHLNTDDVRFAAAWVRHRLSAWLVDGEPGTAHSAELAARAAQSRAERARDRERHEQLVRQAAADPAAHAARIRAMLAEVRRGRR